MLKGIPDLRFETYGYKPTLWKMFYDIYAPFYDFLEHKLAIKASFSEELLRINIAKAMNLIDGNFVLEVCTDTCRNLALFTSIAKGVYIGIDSSFKMLNKCTANLTSISNANVMLLLAYAENLPFKNNVFDRVLIGGCLGHISLKRKALFEAYRVLKSGGLLVVYDQITFIDRLTNKVIRDLMLKPRRLKLTDFNHLFGGHIYIAKFIKL